MVISARVRRLQAVRNRARACAHSYTNKHHFTRNYTEILYHSLFYLRVNTCRGIYVGVLRACLTPLSAVCTCCSISSVNEHKNCTSVSVYVHLDNYLHVLNVGGFIIQRYKLFLYNAQLQCSSLLLLCSFSIYVS